MTKPKMLLSVLALIVLLTGCEPPEEPEWRRAPLEYTCTPEQTKRVQQDTKFCDDNTSYFDTYCYGSAIMRNCQRISR